MVCFPLGALYVIDLEFYYFIHAFFVLFNSPFLHSSSFFGVPHRADCLNPFMIPTCNYTCRRHQQWDHWGCTFTWQHAIHVPELSSWRFCTRQSVRLCLWRVRSHLRARTHTSTYTYSHIRCTWTPWRLGLPVVVAQGCAPPDRLFPLRALWLRGEPCAHSPLFVFYVIMSPARLALTAPQRNSRPC